MPDSTISVNRNLLLFLLFVIGVLAIVLLAIIFWPGAETVDSNPTPELAVVIFSTDEAAAEAHAERSVESTTEASSAGTIAEAPATEPSPVQTPNKANDPSEAGDVVNLKATPTQAAVAGVGFSRDAADNASLAIEPNSAEIAALINRPPDINPLTGLKVDDPALLRRRPIMVRVGNDPGARPQVGLNEAEMVYEEIVEWWVTRFTTINLSRDSDMIAPIRSARLINLQLAPQYGAALANSGASDPVRWELSQTEIANLDEYFVPEPYFYRPNEGWQTRLAFDAKAGRDYLINEELESNVKLRGFAFSEKLDLQSLPQAAVSDAVRVTIPYPKQTSEARWEYDSRNGNYLRFTAGVPFVDFNGDQISASNVIIYFAEHQETEIVEDSNGATSIRIIMNGRGAAWLVRDGKLLKGNWVTNGRATPIFLFDDGRLMPLKPGNSWVQVVPLDYLIDIDGSPQGIIEPVVADEQLETTSDTISSEPNAASSPTPTPIGARPGVTPQSR